MGNPGIIMTPELSTTTAVPGPWKIGGGFLVLLFVILYVLSFSFEASIPLGERPVLLLALVLALAGFAFLYLAVLTIHSKESKRLLVWIIAAGILMRILMFLSVPMLEDDYFRYLWDGAVVANGFNPYEYSPEQIRQGLAGQGEIPPELLALARESVAVIENINHPYLRSIYPPLTQAAFALAHLAEPLSLAAWKIVLLLFDAATLLLLFSILRRLKFSALWIGVYWLNPLLIKEVYNSGHMDLLIIPFLLGAFIFTIEYKPLRAVAALALATGVKIWPVLLLPLVLRPFWRDYKRLLVAPGLFALLCLLLFLPQIFSGLDNTSGLNAYSQRWQLNDSLFKIYTWIALGISKLIGIHPGHSQALARGMAVFTLLGWTGFITLQKPGEPRQIFDRALLIVAGMFLLLPNQFPWYGIWLIPFLVISPRKPLLWLTPLLSLYYLRYYFMGIDKMELFDYGIVWLEFVPVWFLILREWVAKRKLQID